jgi:3-ketoacyl-CoA synthase
MSTKETAGSGVTETITNPRHRPTRLKLAYHLAVSNALYILLAPLLLAVLAHSLSSHPTTPTTPLRRPALLVESSSLPLLASLLGLGAVLATAYLARRPHPVYLLDFACHKPSAAHTVTREAFMRQSAAAGVFTEDNLAFQRRILERSGLGQGTYFPRAVLSAPPNPCMAEARAEAEAVMFGAIDRVLAKTGVSARDVGVVVVNCSLFNPTPSLSAMVVNHYKMRGDVASYNLGGMGCSAGLISIDLAKQLLQVVTSS